MTAALACTLTILYGATPAATAQASALVVRDAWVRESTAARTSSSGYLTIENRGDRPVALVKVMVAGVGDAAVHATEQQDGRSIMRPVPRLSIPARATLALAPGGTHLMLADIARPLKVGAAVSITLTFDNGQTRTARAVVRPLSAMALR